MFEAITAWSTIAMAIATFLGVYVAYWGIKRQTETLASSVSADLALKLIHEFDGDKSRQLRSRAADALLKRLKLPDIDELFDYFEKIGVFVRKGLVDRETAHSFFFHWVNLYWVAGQHIIEEKRTGAANLWTDFELLYKTLLAIEIKTDPKSRFINPWGDLIKQCLEEELE